MTSIKPGFKEEFKPLWKNRDFLKLWIAQGTADFGARITGIAIPLTAVLMLEASPFQMGILNALNTICFLLFGLFIGVWVDRLKRKPILVFSNIARGVLLLSIPLASFSGYLSMNILYIVAFSVGFLTVFFDVAYMSYVPNLVKKEQLVDANSKLEITGSISSISGPGIAGSLIQLISAPFVIIIDACALLLSGILLNTVKKEEPLRNTNVENNIWKEIKEGLNIVFKNSILRTFALTTATLNLFDNLILTVYFLYITNQLGLSAIWIGIILSTGSIFSLLGATIVNRITSKFGIGKTIFGSVVISVISYLLIIPTNIENQIWVISLLIISRALMGLSKTIYNVNQVSIRQAIVPDNLLGRMTASMRFIIWGTFPIGALLGGVLGEMVGLWNTILIGALGVSLAIVVMYFSPILKIRNSTDVEEGNYN